MLQISSFIVLGLATLYFIVLIAQKVRLGRLASTQHDLQSQLLKRQIDDVLLAIERKESQQDAWQGWRKFRVTKIEQESKHIKSFYLQPHDGKPLPQFHPGQHLTFRLKLPELSRPVVRCYSLSGNANSVDTYRVTVRHQFAPPQSNAPHGLASTFLHSDVAQDTILDAKAPSGKFYLDTLEHCPIVLIAGGVGITPFISMIETLNELESQRAIHLFYSSSLAEDMAQVSRLKELQQQLSQLTVHYFISKDGVADLPDNWHVGRMSVAGILNTIGSKVNPKEADFFLCGPMKMMKGMSAEIVKSGVDASRVHYESFGPATVPEPKNAQKSQVKSHSVGFQLTDKSATWNSDSGTLLDFAENQGVAIDSGCRTGSCGTCLTAILKGSVEYIQEPDSDVEAGSCLPCIAIPKTDLKLNA